MSDVLLDEQLLTALMDGQLVGEERARAEKLLAENPEYQRRIQQWQAQSTALRGLPAYSLDDGFSTRVLQSLTKNHATGMNVVASLRSDWRTGLAAIVTLAAMLLLTLFVFPQISRLNPVASTAAVTSLTPGLESEVLRDESLVSEEAGERQDFGIEHFQRNRLKSATSNPSQVTMSESDGPNDRPGSGLGGGPALAFKGAADLDLDSTESGIAENAAVQLFSGTAARPNVRSAKNIELETQQAADSSKLARKKMDELSPEPTQQNQMLEQNQTNISQVYFVDFNSTRESAETVTNTLLRNRIQIVDNRAMANQAVINEKIFVGMEVMMVRSTPDQMQQAIQELSQKAAVSDYLLPQQPLSESQQAFRKLEAAKESKDMGIAGPGQSTVGSASGADDQFDEKQTMSDLIADAEQRQRTEADKQESGRFEFNAKSRYQIQPEGTLLSKAQGEENNVGQYLLLIRRSTVEPAPPLEK